VQGAPGESAARQCLVYLYNAKRQHPKRGRSRPLDPPDAVAELRKKSPSRVGHTPKTPFIISVLFLFLSAPFVNGAAKL
jgi:hypothetical protein